MEKPVLNVEVREQTGKEMAKKLRAQGIIPAVFYGPRSEPLSLKVDPRELAKTLRTEAGENVIIDLNIKRGNESLQKVVMLKEVQMDPLQTQAVHVDFYEVSMDVRVTVEVPIHLLGKSEGVKMGGILDQVLRTIEIECLPGDIPKSIDADVSALKIGDSIHVRDLHFGKGKILTDSNITVASIVPPTAEAKPAEAAPEEAVAAEAEEKEEEEQKEGEK